MSHSYSASFTIPSGLTFTQQAFTISQFSAALSGSAPFVVTSLTSGDPTPDPATTVGQFLGVTAFSVTSITGGRDIAEFITASTASSTSVPAVLSIDLATRKLVVDYDNYAPSSGADYITVGDTFTVVITTSSVLPAAAAPAPAPPAPTPATSVSKASPTTIRYKKVVCWGLSPQAVNFAQASTLGHRVSIVLPVDLMNKYFKWTRASQEVAPTGRFVKNPTPAVAGSDFVSQLVKAFGQEYTDLDGVANGLNFSSSALEVAGDIMRDPCVYNSKTDTGLPGAATGISNTHYGANDLVMAYLMFKCFGSSSYDPTDIIYNVDDAYNMLSSQQLADVISASLEAEDALANAAVQPNGKPVPLQLAGDNKGQVDAMFRGFLASDPLRYFIKGVQIPGLFETNFVCPPSDPSVGGNWCLTVGDKIEMPLQLVFRAPVTVLSVQDNVQNPSSATPDSSRTEVIKGEAATFDCTAQKAALANVISIRLQITCGKPDSGSSTGSTSVDPTATIPLTVAASSSVVFYTNKANGVQKAATMAVAGGANTLVYSKVDPANWPAGVTLDTASGVLTYTPTGLGPWGKWALPVTVTDGAAGSAPFETRYINVSFDDGNGSSNNNSIFLDAKAKNAGVNTFVGLKKNPLYASLPNNGVVQGAQTLVYASPPFASSAANSAVVASTFAKNLENPLSVDELTIKYTFPAALSLSATEPAVPATKVKWSITSQSGRSGPGAPGVLPAGVTFTGSATLSTAVEAKLKIDLSTVAADYSPGNAAGNVPGVYKFLITTVDENQYIQSFPVSINIAVPSPTSAVTPLAATGNVTARSYANGGKLTYSKTGATVGGVALPITDVIALVSDVGLDGNAYHTWTAVPVGTGLPALTFTFTPNTTAPDKNKATVAIDAAAGAAAVGLYPYLISALDANNIVQTVFYTIEIMA